MDAQVETGCPQEHHSNVPFSHVTMLWQNLRAYRRRSTEKSVKRAKRERILS